MGRNSLAILGGLILMAAIAFIFKFAIPFGVPFADGDSQCRYLFINQTTDHRFDESIRVSIMAAQKRTGIQNAVIISEAFPEDIEKRAAELFSKLRIGSGWQGKGILYLFNPQSRQLKIEVGYALEGVLPDVVVKQLEQAAKSFVYSDRYQDFWAELINTLNIYAQNSGQDLLPPSAQYFKYFSGGGGVYSGTYGSSIEQLKRDLRKLTPGQNYRAFPEVVRSLESYMNSLRDGVSDLGIDVLSDQSRVYRVQTPLTSYHLIRNWKMAEQAKLDKVFEVGNWAFVFFKKGHPVLPVVFHKQKQVWRVQEAMAWSLFHRFEDSSKVYLKYSMRGLSAELQNYMETHFGRPLYLLSRPIELESISASEENSVVADYFQYFDIASVGLKFGQKDLSSLTLDELWVLFDSYLSLGQYTASSQVYQEIASRLKDEAWIQTNAKFYSELAKFESSDWCSPSI